MQHERLKEARIERGFRTGTEAAKAIGVSVATYNSHENGHRSLTLRSAEQYARYFDVRSSWLLTGEEPKRHAAGWKNLAEQGVQEQAQRENPEWGTFHPGTSYRGTLPGAVPEIDAKQPKNSRLDVVGEWLMPPDFLTDTLQADRGGAFLMKALDNAVSPSLNEGDRGIVDGSKTTFAGDGIYVIEDYEGQLHFRVLTKVLFARNPEEEVSVGTKSATEFIKFSDLTIVGRLIGRVGRI